MSRNREHVKPVESQSDSGSSEEDDSEPEQTTQMAAKSQQLPPQQAPSSSEEDESGSETESEESQKSSYGARKAGSKPNAPEPVIPTKRPDEGTDTKNTKRLRKTVECDPSEKIPLEKKSNLFQRIWSEDDEIVILKGMLDYISKYKSDPISDLNAFHDFIKKNLHIDVTRTQLQDKIRRLKKKYENNKGKERKKPHEQNAYDLSKMIWGNETGKKESGGVKVVGSPKANVSKKVNAAETEEAKDVKIKDVKIVSGEGEKLHAVYFGLLEERMLIAGEEYFGLGQGQGQGKQDWQKLRVEEIKLFHKQLEVRVAQAKLVLEAMKARDH